MGIELGVTRWSGVYECLCVYVRVGKSDTMVGDAMVDDTMVDDTMVGDTMVDE